MTVYLKLPNEPRTASWSSCIVWVDWSIDDVGTWRPRDYVDLILPSSSSTSTAGVSSNASSVQQLHNTSVWFMEFPVRADVADAVLYKFCSPLTILVHTCLEYYVTVQLVNFERPSANSWQNQSSFPIFPRESNLKNDLQKWQLICLADCVTKYWVSTFSWK